MIKYKIAKNTIIIKSTFLSTCINYIALTKLLPIPSLFIKSSTKSPSISKVTSLAKTVMDWLKTLLVL